MSGMISVTAIGNLGRDPEVRSAQNGDKIVNLNLAVSSSWVDKASGERKERTEWLRVVVFNQHIANVAEKYLTKGSQVCIHNAELQTRKWTDQSGVEKYTTEVVLGRFKGELTLLGSAKDRPAATSGGGAGSPVPPPIDLDDEIPF